MNFQQQGKDKMMIQVIKVFLENKTDFDSVPAFGETMQRLMAIHQDISDTVEKQILDISGTTKSKVNLKSDLALAAFTIAGNIYSWAKDTNDTVVLGQSKFSLGRLKKINDQLMGPTCRNILNLAVTNADALVKYGVTAESIQRFTQLIDAFTTLSMAPTSKKKDRSMLTKKLVELFKEADNLFKNKLDKMIMNLQLTKVDTFKSYQAAREMPHSNGGTNDDPPTPTTI